MATQVKRRRGTTAENDNFTGAMAEFTFDTETHHIRVHDGVKQGGYVIPVITDPLNPGKYTKVTIDDQGLVVGAEPLSADDLPNEIPMDKVFGLPLALENKQDKIYAGENIVIDETTISAIDTKYTAGEGIIISQDNVISSTGAAGAAKWGEIVDDIEKQTDLMARLATKQDELTSANAGTNVSITKVGGVVKINAAGGSGGTGDYNELINKPSVNSVELSGNKTLSDLGIQPAGDYATKTELGEKQDTIEDLKDIRSNAESGAMAATTISGYGDIVTHNANEFALPGDIPTKTSELDNDIGFITSVYHDDTKQDKTDNSLATVDKTVVGAINEVKDKVQEIEAARFVDATIIGEPSILQGQVSDFSTVSYLQFPFTLDLHNKAFQIDFCFTTATNVQTQQNILDSRFGLALAISGGKGVMAISNNGTSWDIGSATGTIDIQSNTTYYARVIWNRLQYKTQLSTDGVNYTDDMVIVDTRSPFPTTIYIGGCDQAETGHTPHPFLGTINMNKASVSVMGVTIWQGMGDIGLATKANVSLDNLDATGEARFNAKQNKLVAGENITIDEETNTISATGGSGLPDQTGNEGKFLTTNGTDASWSDKPLINKSTRENSVQIASNESSIGDYQVIAGVGASGKDHYAIAMGYQAHADYGGMGIGYAANASAMRSIQIGTGTNREAKTLNVGFDWNINYKLLNSNGIIPDERLAAKPAEDGHYVLFLNKISDTQSSVSWVEDQSEEALEKADNALDAVDTLSGQVVHKTGVETISDTKILNNGNLQLRSNSFSATEKTSTTTQMSQQIIRLHDVDDQPTGELSIKRTGNIGDTKCCLYAHNTTDGNDNWSEFAIHATDDGRQFATCPTPASTSNDSSIATTAWVNNKMKVVDELPASIDANTFYFIKE